MTHNIIKTENYLLVVDDSEIKEGKTLLSKRGIIHTNIGWNYGDKVIIAHLPLNNSPVLEGVSLLPPLEDEVEELAQKYVEDEVKPDIEPRGYNQDLRIGIYGGSVTGFIYSYNKAKEKYNADLGELLSDFYLFATNGEVCDHEVINEFIQSLQQPKMPVGFECEDEYVHDDTVPYPKTLGTHPKTIVNPKGQTVLVGKYIY